MNQPILKNEFLEQHAEHFVKGGSVALLLRLFGVISNNEIVPWFGAITAGDFARKHWKTWLPNDYIKK